MAELCMYQPPSRVSFPWHTRAPTQRPQVPEDERERTEKGWKNMLFDRLQAMMGGKVM